MVTVVIWPESQSFLQPVFGVPAWERTANLLGRGNRRLCWVGDSPTPSIESIRPSQLVQTIHGAPGVVLVCRAALPCLEIRTIRKLIRRASAGASMLMKDGRVLLLALSPAGTPRLRKPAELEQLAQAVGAKPIAASEDELLWTRDAESLQKATERLRYRQLDGFIRKGVLFDDPSQVQLAPDVVIGAGTRIASWVLLGEGTRIGKGCRIGAFNHVLRSSIGDETVVLDHCYISDSRIGKSAQLGPFSHLRPASRIGDEAKVGNFVELKNARLATGTKVSHLAYVGDAITGRNVNIGAGVITCNYDGEKKHQTVVGDGAFIGSDVQLVAPVRVGKGAFVAAGSCIVADVPARSLAVARSRQFIKRGWAKARGAIESPARKKS